MPQDLKKAQTYGGRKICFENDEVTDLKRFDPAGDTILYDKIDTYIKDVKLENYLANEITVIINSLITFFFSYFNVSFLCKTYKD